ncbi:DNA alkylation repair protein [Agromyces tardus]|uniref:DNA alkylation repair protein n=1 Tax=Agromyces tardus TaxID=2583849 RepID=A0A3M8ALX9_9MICO|nr:DNA alkylation repair protein [Agromyces tardus]
MRREVTSSAAGWSPSRIRRRAAVSRRENRTVTLPAAEFIDSTLRAEGSEARAEADAERIGGGLRFYGASVGAVRGTVRDADRRHPISTHDEATALAAELWSVPVYERRFAAIVVLQRHAAMLVGNDLTRLEQFLRDARVRELVDPLVGDVVRPLLERLQGPEASRARRITDRWASEADPHLRWAASLL